jgi:hypothetical protein|tara:strand:+ start:2331 stop:2507 length:177 start_codon:yes stop_codon:yes gene_type:complete
MASVSDNLQAMIDTLMGAMKDAEKHERGTDAASRRLRGALSATAKSCKTLRGQIQDER